MDIVISGVTKKYGDNVVFHNFSVRIEKNRTTFITGPSGCGKTTLISMLMGITAPDSGTITGVPALKSAVFQEDRLCENFNAVSNVRLVCDKRIKNSTIIEHLERVGLKDILSKPVSEFSGGMKRRVAIVRAVLAKSEILFLDEPFKGLDNENKKLVMDYIEENTKGKTVIIVTHDTDMIHGNVLSLAPCT
ncbi:MAG TPA: ABC transporter ATP-binding protein [Clostridiaceae bacterium]|nr:ABC transporter ATP-binding protein [Clostridiaceae bacterium]